MMPKVITELCSLNAAIALIEVLEIQGNNEHINRIQTTCYQELSEMLDGVTPSFLVSLVIEARRQARDSVIAS